MSTEPELAGLAVMVVLGLVAITGLLLLYARQRSYAEELRQSEARLRAALRERDQREASTALVPWRRSN